MSKGRRIRRDRPVRSRPRSRRDERTFATRHRFMVVLLWAQVPILAAVGLSSGLPANEIAVASLTLVVLAVLGMAARSHSLASYIVSTGWITASGILVYFTDGLTAAHFHFSLAVVAISFYRDWRTLAVGAAYVVAYQFSAGLLTVGEAPTDPVVTPIWWATIYSGSIILLALLLMAGWRVTAKVESLGGSSEERFRLSFEGAPLGMAILAPSGDFIQVNDAMARLLGYDVDHFTGAGIRSVIHGDDLPELGEIWEKMGNSASHRADTWLRAMTASGRTIWARASLSLVPWSPDQSAIVVLQLEDATRAYHEQKRLERLIEGKDEFVAAIGDELHRPLASLIDLAGPTGVGGDSSHTLGRIEAHAREVVSIVDDLIVSARADGGALSFVARPVDAGDLCRDVIENVPGAEDTPLDIGATALWADPGLTRQIVNNLLTNAVRYGGPNLRVRTVGSGPDTLIQVIDDGPELPEAERDRIFSGDLRGGPPVTKPASVGLGLTVARLLARQMDGDVVYRRTNDRRNVFELRLPSEQITLIQKPRPDQEELGIPA